MSTLSEISKLIRELRNFLETRLTPQLMNSLQTALDAINQTLGDPNVQNNIKVTLEQLKQLLETANQEHLVEQIAELTSRVREILSQVDPETVGNVVNTLHHLLSEADKANIIENISKALDSVTCLKDLVNIAKELALPTKVFLYGTTGAVIGMAITLAIQAYLKQKKDEKLQQSIDQLVAINYQQLYVQIHQLRISSGTFLMQVSAVRHQFPDIKLQESVLRIEEEQTRLLNVLSPMDINSMELLQKAQEFANKMLEKVYQPELDNEPIELYLDRVGTNTACWNALVTYTTYYPQYRLFETLARPELPRDNLNYFQIKKLYGVKTIDNIMQALVKKLEQQGGQEFYAALANSFENTPEELQLSIQKIQERDANFRFPKLPWKAGAEKLLAYYCHCHDDIRQWWIEANWHMLGTIPEVTEHIAEIIQARALLQFCYQSAQWLCFPRNIPREMLNGAIDVPMGVYHLLTTNPITTATNLWNTVVTAAGRQGFVDRIYYHPTRVVTNIGVSSGLSYGANSFFSPKAPPPPPDVSQLPRNMIKQAGRISVKSPLTSSGASTAKTATGISTSAASAGEGAVLSTGNLAQRKTLRANVEEKSQEERQVEMPEIQAAIITDAAFLQLKQKLSSVNSLDGFYAEFATWYENICSPVSRQTTIQYTSERFHYHGMKEQIEINSTSLVYKHVSSMHK